MVLEMLSPSSADIGVGAIPVELATRIQDALLDAPAETGTDGVDTTTAEDEVPGVNSTGLSGDANLEASELLAPRSAIAANFGIDTSLICERAEDFGDGATRFALANGKGADAAFKDGCHSKARTTP